MRTSDGVPAGWLAAMPQVVDELLAGGLVVAREGRICPTLQGFLFADRIAARIVQAWGDGSGGGG
jgi:hypothetical protein